VFFSTLSRLDDRLPFSPPSGGYERREGKNHAVDEQGGAAVTSENVGANPEKDPEDWKTGDEPMTGPQASYLETLAREAGEEFDPKLTKAEASKRIDELQAKTGRGA